jgi:hypothetical protein
MATFLDLVNSNSNPTPFGINDRDDHFQSDADGLVTFVKRRLGDDIMSVELTNKQIYACFEEATLEYSKEINLHQAESHMSNLLGLKTGSLVSYKTNSDDKYIGTYTDLQGREQEGILDNQDKDSLLFSTNTVTIGSDTFVSAPVVDKKIGPHGKEQLFPRETLEYLIRRSEPYASEANIGGSVNALSGSIKLEAGRQDYNIYNELEIALSGSNQAYNLKEYDATTNINSIFNPNVKSVNNLSKTKIRINEIFHFSPQAAYRFFDTTSAINYLNNQFAFESFTPETVFYVLPVFEDLLRAGQLDISNRVRRSNYSYTMQGQNLRIFPRPSSESSRRLFIKFSFPSDPFKTSLDYEDSTITGVSNLSNLPYGVIPYKTLNSIARQWIKQYTLALSRETLGLIRSKFSTVPIPGSDVTMNGSELVSQGREDQDKLVTSLKEMLDKLTYQKLLEADSAQSEAMINILKRVPIPNGRAIIIG